MLMLCIRAKGPEQAEGELSARWFCTFPPWLPLCQQMGSRGWGVGLSTILQGILCTMSPAALGLQSLGTTPAALGGHPTPETVLVFPLCFEGRKDLIVCVAREGADLQAAPQPSAAACRVHTARPDSDTHMLWPISSWVDVSAKRFPSVVVPGHTQVQLDQG